VISTFRTPRGLTVTMTWREGTSDWNTLNACMTEDEYGFRGRSLAGVAVDVGAHIGGVTVGLALDNPGLHVIAIEPVPDNVMLLRENVARAGVSDRVTIHQNAAGGSGPVTVWYGYRGDEAAEHHAYIGNSSLAYDRAAPISHQTVRYPKPVRLSALGLLSVVKIDCEGGEYVILEDPAAASIPLILGEWHPVRHKTQADVTALLAPHVVTFTGPAAGPGGFEAVLA